MEMEYRGTLERKGREEKSEALPLPGEYYEAYKEGNLRFPQSGLGMDVLVAAAALNDPHFKPDEFARMEWTEEQLADIRETMNRAHAAMHIPVASSEERLADTVTKIEARHGAGAVPRGMGKVISDNTLRRLWFNTRDSVLLKMAILSGLDGGTKDWADSSRADKESIDAATPRLAERLRDTEVRSRVGDAFASFAETLRGEKARDLMKQIKSVVDNRRRGLPAPEERQVRDDEVGSLFYQLYELMVD